MIQYFKDVIQDSWLLKGFLGLLTLSFGVWGIGDFLNPGMDPKIAVTVGKTDIGLDDVQSRYTRELDRFKASLGNVDSDDMKRSILNATVQEMSQGIALDAAADDMGIVMTNAHLRDIISKDPAFKDDSGAFSQLKFNQILYDNRLTERGFLQLYSAQLRDRELIEPAVQNSAAPKSLVDALLAYRGESRIADTLLVSSSTMPAPPAPSDDELKKLYNDNISAFTLPEYRKVEAVVVRSDDLVSPDSFTDEQLKAYYDENVERYRTRETRKVSQIVFDTKEQAEAARAMATPGDHLEQIAKKAKTNAVDLGEVAKTSPLVKTMGAAYDVPVGEISQPIQSDLGWHLFEVKEIKPEVVREFATVREEIRKTMAADKGVDALYDASQTLEDEVISGTPMADIAQKINGQHITIDAMDNDGKDPRGLEAKGLFDNDHFIQAAFALQVGGDSKLMEIPKGYYMLKVAAITPPTPKPFADVQKQVVAIYDKQKRVASARDVATKIAAEIKPDTTLEPIAAKDNAPLAQLGPLTRFGEGASKDILIDSKRVSPDLLQKLFSAKVGDVVTAPVVDGVVIARLREISPPPSADKGEEQLVTTIRQAIANDLANAVSKGFSDRYPVQVNNAALDSIVTTTH